MKIENNIQIEKPLRINKEKEEELNNEAICKICLSNSNKKNLINICNCKGTMKYVHYECILVLDIKFLVDVHFRVFRNDCR